MIGRVNKQIEISNDVAWNTFGFRCYSGDKSAPVNASVFTAYLRLREDDDAAVINLNTAISGNQVSIDVSQPDMAAIAPGVYSLEMNVTLSNGEVRQIRGSVLVIEAV